MVGQGERGAEGTGVRVCSKLKQQWDALHALVIRYTVNWEEKSSGKCIWVPLPKHGYK